MLHFLVYLSNITRQLDVAWRFSISSTIRKTQLSTNLSYYYSEHSVLCFTFENMCCFKTNCYFCMITENHRRLCLDTKLWREQDLCVQKSFVTWATHFAVGILSKMLKYLEVTFNILKSSPRLEIQNLDLPKQISVHISPNYISWLGQ